MDKLLRLYSGSSPFLFISLIKILIVAISYSFFFFFFFCLIWCLLLLANTMDTSVLLSSTFFMTNLIIWENLIMAQWLNLFTIGTLFKWYLRCLSATAFVCFFFQVELGTDCPPPITCLWVSFLAFKYILDLHFTLVFNFGRAFFGFKGQLHENDFLRHNL